MAIGWLTVLKLVPWGDVIKNAPVVADGAKKLWDSVSRKPPPAVNDKPPPAAAGDALPADVLQARLADAQASIAALHEQMQASSTLIKALAEQNTELIRRVETIRVRTLWLAAAVLVLGVVAALGWR
ncbi:MAG TPA: hypothetical protein VGE16_12985 [Albitalea sp.]